MLRQGGKFAMTVWCGPEVSPCFAAVYGAIKAHGHPEVSIPSGPDFHQFARRGAAVELLADAGFSNIDVTTVDCVWDLNSPDELFEIYARGTVRVAMLLAKQPPQNLARHPFCIDDVGRRTIFAGKTLACSCSGGVSAGDRLGRLMRIELRLGRRRLRRPAPVKGR